MKEEWHNYIKKYLIIIVLSLLLGACGQSESQKDTKKDSISSEETMAYLERLTDPYVEMINIMITELVNIEEKVMEKFQEVDDTSLSILQELEEDYEEDVDEIEDLINLASTLQDMVEIGRDDIFQIDDYSETIGFLVGEVSNKHLGGKIPDSLDKLLTEMDLSEDETESGEMELALENTDEEKDEIINYHNDYIENIDDKLQAVDQHIDTIYSDDVTDEEAEEAADQLEIIAEKFTAYMSDQDPKSENVQIYHEIRFAFVDLLVESIELDIEWVRGLIDGSIDDIGAEKLITASYEKYDAAIDKFDKAEDILDEMSMQYDLVDIDSDTETLESESASEDKVDFFLDESNKDLYHEVINKGDYEKLYKEVETYMDREEIRDDDLAHDILKVLKPALELIDDVIIEYDEFDKRSTIHYDGLTDISADNYIVPFLENVPNAEVNGDRLYLHIGFEKEGWLFADAARIRIGEEVKTVAISGSHFDTDVLNNGLIREESVQELSGDSDDAFIENMLELDGEDVIMRFEGKKGKIDYTLSSTDIKALEVINTFKAVNANLADIYSEAVEKFDI